LPNLGYHVLYYLILHLGPVCIILGPGSVEDVWLLGAVPSYFSTGHFHLTERQSSYFRTNHCL